MIHKLKIKKKYADAICGGAKRFEIRKEDDKHFDVGDIVTFDVCDFGGRHSLENKAYFISYILRHEDFPEGIPEGYCVFTIVPLDLHNVEESDVVDFARDIVNAAIGVIETSPTVDAEPIRHGVWKFGCGYHDFKGNLCVDEWDCSVCDESVGERTKFCPKCGQALDF